MYPAHHALIYLFLKKVAEPGHTGLSATRPPYFLNLHPGKMRANKAQHQGRKLEKKKKKSGPGSDLEMAYTD